MDRNLILVALSLFAWGVGEGMFFYIQPLYLETLGASPQAIGNILGLAGMAMIAFHIPAGHLADRWGRRPLMWAAWICGLSAAWVMALAQQLPLFVAGLLLYSTTTFVMAPMSSYITQARGAMSVGRALTLVLAAYNLGSIIGPALGGSIGETFTIQTTYRVAAGFFAVSTVVILLIRAQPVDSAIHNGQSKNFTINKPYRRYLILIFGVVFSAYLAQPLTANYLHSEHQLGLAKIGQLGSIASAGVVVLSLLLGRLRSRVAFLIGQGLVLIFCILLWRGNGWTWFAAGYFLLGGFRVLRSMVAAQTRQFVSGEHMGLAYGISEATGAAAIALAPPAAGYLFSIQSALMYPIAILAIAASILFSLRFLQHTQE